MQTPLAYLRDTSSIFLRLKTGSTVLGREENCTVYHTSSVQLYFTRSFCKAIGIHFSWYPEERYTSIIDAFTPVSNFAYWDDYPSWPILLCPPATPGHLAHRGQPKKSFFSFSGRTSSQPPAQPAFSVITARVFHANAPRISDGLIGTANKISLKYSLHLLRMSFSMLGRTKAWYVMDLV